MTKKYWEERLKKAQDAQVITNEVWESWDNEWHHLFTETQHDIDEAEQALIPHQRMNPRFTHALDVRTSYKYRDGYSHLDNWESLGSFREVTRRSVQFSDDGIDLTLRRQIVVKVKTEKGTPLKKIKMALSDYYVGSSCTHDYDCCGCWHTMVSDVRKRLDGTFILHTSSYRNY